MPAATSCETEILVVLNSKRCQRFARMILAIVFASSGCDHPAPPPALTDQVPVNAPVNPPAHASTEILSTGVAEQVAPSAASNTRRDAAEREYWDAIFFEDSQVGYAHTLYGSVQEKGQQLVQITAESQLSIQRFNQVTRQQLNYRSIETSAGEVVRFESSMSSGDGASTVVTLEARGEVRGNKIDLHLGTLGKTQHAELPWDKSWGGFFSPEQSLERQPLQPGEKRTLRALTPGFNQTAEIEFSAGQVESTSTLDGPRELLKIQSRIKLGENVLEQIVWTDPTGQTIKTYMPAMKQVSYRTSKEKALAKNTGTFDLGKQSIVPVARSIDRPHQTRQVVYRATMTSGDPRSAFAQGGTQSVKSIDAQTVEVTVRSLRPTDELGGEFPADSPPTPDDLLPNSLIQSDDEEIVRLAGQIAPDKVDPWEVAVALEKHVRTLVSNKNFSQALSSAADVVRSREGDCTEHAVLLAALCRARKIPARITIGLVYYRPSHGFAYHMWTEAWVKDRWLPLDATLGLGGIGATHLAVSHSNLKGMDPLTQFLPVLQLIGNLKLDVLRVE